MPIYRAIYIPRPKYRTFISRVTRRKYVQNVHIPLPWLVRHPRTWQHILPTLLITVLERTVHRVPHLPLHILPVTRKLVRAGAVRINRSRLIVNNRQIIRNSRASSIASLQYNRHQERRPTTAGLTAHRPAQLRSERQHVPHPKQVPCTGVGRINGPRHFSLQRHVKHNTTPKQRPRRRQEHLPPSHPCKKHSTAPQMITPRNLLRCLLTWQIRRAIKDEHVFGPT